MEIATEYSLIEWNICTLKSSKGTVGTITTLDGEGGLRLATWRAWTVNYGNQE